jgi:polar amino acid transport system substrate-binding protein
MNNPYPAGWGRIMIRNKLWTGWLLCLFSCGLLAKEEITLVTHEYKPYSWVEESGDATGLTVEIANLMFQRANIEKSWKFMPSKRAYSYAKNKPNTCVFPLQRNQEREADFQWVGPIMINRYAFYTLEGSGIRLENLADLKRYKVVSYLGSGLREYLQGFGISTIEALKDEVAATMVSIGRVQVWATDVFSVPYTIEQQENTFDQQFVFFTSISAMACHQSMSKELIDQLQAELTQLYLTQEIAKIVRRYER